MQVCVEPDQGDPTNQSVIGFRFLEFGSTNYMELNSPCGEIWISYDLSKNRLIGFKVLATGDRIRSIQPIVDCPDCSSVITFVPGFST